MTRPSSTEKIVTDEGAQLDFSKDMSYSDYLHLAEILRDREQGRSLERGGHRLSHVDVA